MWDVRKGKRCSYISLVLKYCPLKVMVSPVRQRANCCEEQPQAWGHNPLLAQRLLSRPGVGTGAPKRSRRPQWFMQFLPIHNNVFQLCCRTGICHQVAVKMGICHQVAVRRELAKACFCLQCCIIYLFSLATQSTHTVLILFCSAHLMHQFPPGLDWNKKSASCLTKSP